MSNSIEQLDKEDQENLQFILQKMYPESSAFKENKPSIETLKFYMQALKANTFCNKAMAVVSTNKALLYSGLLAKHPNYRKSS
jgi:hypothetical protein